MKKPLPKPPDVSTRTTAGNARPIMSSSAAGEPVGRRRDRLSVCAFGGGGCRHHSLERRWFRRRRRIVWRGRARGSVMRLQLRMMASPVSQRRGRGDVARRRRVAAGEERAGEPEAAREKCDERQAEFGRLHQRSAIGWGRRLRPRRCGRQRQALDRFSTTALESRRPDPACRRRGRRGSAPRVERRPFTRRS